MFSKTRRFLRSPRRVLSVLLLTLAAAAASLFAITRWWLSPEAVRAMVLENARGQIPEPFALRLGRARWSLGEGLILEEARLEVPASSLPQAVFGELEAPRGDASWPVAQVSEARLEFSTWDLLRGDVWPTRVEVEDVALETCRTRDGRWLHESLLRAAAAEDGEDEPPQPTRPLPDVIVRRGRLRLIDAATDDAPVSVEVREISADLVLGASGRGDRRIEGLRFHVEGETDACPRALASGVWSPREGKLRLENISVQLDLARRSKIRLPGQIQSHLESYGVRGFVEVIGHLDIDAGQRVSGCDLTAIVSRFRATEPRTGFAIEGASGTVRVGDAEVVVERLNGLSTAGPFDASGKLRIQQIDGSLEVLETTLAAHLPTVQTGETVRKLLPSGVVKFLREQQIEGSLDVSASLSAAGWDPSFDNWTLTIRPREINARPERFPYPVRSITGELVIEDGVLRLDPGLRALAGTGELVVSGSLDLRGMTRPEPRREHPSGLVRIDWLGASADTAVRDVLEPASRAVWDRFRPAGKADARILLEWPRERDDKAAVTVTVRPRDLGLQPVDFPLPFQRLDGEIVFDLTHDRVVIPQLRGRYRNQLIVAEGRVLYDAQDAGERRPEVTIDLRCPSLSYSEEVVEACPETVRPAIRSLRAKGRAEVHVSLRSQRGEALGVSVRLGFGGANQLVVHPELLPFAARCVGGHVVVDAAGVRLHDVRSDGTPGLTVGGAILPEGDAMIAHLRGEVRGLPSEERFYASLSADSRLALENLQLRGLHDFAFETDFVCNGPADTPRRYRFKLSNIRSRDAGIDVGLILRDVALRGEVEGEGIIGGQHTCRGTLVLETARFNDLHLTDAHVRFVYGAPHPLLDARPGRAGWKRAARLIDPSTRDRLGDTSLRDTLQVELEPAKLYGGDVLGFFYADLGQLGDMKGAVEASGIDIREAARDIHGRPDLEASGIGSGEARFSGLTGDVQSLLGRGSVAIRDGNIAEIPVLSQLLKTLALGSVVKLDRMEAEFDIRDGRFHANKGQVFIGGGALNLRGRGTMDFAGNLDMQFTPELIPGGVSIVNDLQKNLAHVRVTGTYEEPRAKLMFLRLVPVPFGGGKP